MKLTSDENKDKCAYCSYCIYACIADVGEEVIALRNNEWIQANMLKQIPSVHP